VVLTILLATSSIRQSRYFGGEVVLNSSTGAFLGFCRISHRRLFKPKPNQWPNVAANLAWHAYLPKYDVYRDKNTKKAPLGSQLLSS